MTGFPANIKNILVNWTLQVEIGVVELVTVGLLSAVAYLMGSIPTGYLVVRRLKARDIRRAGSKNVGALNAFHQVGVIGGLVVLLVDAGKGALAALIPGWLGAPIWAVYFTAVLVVGHNWPVFLKFQGGKGAASILGISLVIVPQLTLIALVPTVLVVAITRNVVLGVGAGFIIVNVLALTTGQPSGQVALCLSLSLLVVGTYVVGTWGQIRTAFKTRQFRGLFYGPNFNP